MSKSHGASIKDDATYEALREKGHSKSRSAAIANAQARDDMQPSRKGGHAPPFEDWSKADLMERARDLDVAGRSRMSKDALITALRS